MPATEQTWRDSRLMHVIFGVSGLAMLGATLWMLAADHDREWKDYQRGFKKVEAWSTHARLDAQKTDAFEQKREALEEALEKARSTPPDGGLIAQFASVITEHEGSAASVAAVTAADSNLRENPNQRSRDALIDAINRTVREAKFQEDELSSKLKFTRADLDVARSNYDLGVGEGFSIERLAELQKAIDTVQADVDALSAKVETAKVYRKALEAVVAQIRSEETEAKKALEDHDADVVRLTTAYEEQTDPWRSLLELPIVDAFNSPLKVKQIWLPKLTLNNNFRDVARFDRCTTCHLGIDATAAGSAVEPAYRPIEMLSIKLATPAAPPEKQKTEDGKEIPRTTRELYGMTLAAEGLVRASDVTIDVVDPRSPAAMARLQSGDVLVEIGGVKVTSPQRAETYLTESVAWGKPLEIRVRRGVPQPYSSHPRLDLFVGSLSPHQAQVVGCTICHEGQGSATAFKWASHSPNTHAEGEAWRTEHGWFDNHHWIFPMRPTRFLESGCLKCHHEVTELEPSKRFPDPPAPKLMKGFNLVRQYGCFGCHEINGFDGPDKRIGPDLRAEPNFSFAALQLLTDPNLSPREKLLAERVAKDPSNDNARRELSQLVEADSRRAVAASGGQGEAAHLSADSHTLASLLADVETPGTYRKVGPSLRHLASKVDRDWLYNWVREPKDFRPTTRMPQFFGLWGHLLPEPKLDSTDNPVLDDDGHMVMEESAGRAESERFEPIEIRAISEYLLASSQPFEYAGKPEGVTEDPSSERGKERFQLRGCLACHQHSEFPDAKQVQGPDLSRIGAKLDTPNGPKWLYSWVRQPNRYHSRTVMPDVFLEPIQEKDKDGKVTGTTDPAADITAYLLGSQQGWKPKPVPELDRAALTDLAMMHLTQAYPRKRAEKYLEEGIPERERAGLKGDEVALVGKFTDDETRLKHTLQYVGRRSISKYGCSGCHDIPGYENAKPIGTGLADWGRKDPSKLAFEQIVSYIGRTHGMDEGGEHAEHGAAGGHHELPEIKNLPPDEGFFLEKLLHHSREGFLWQKLRDPRSYDYKKTENKTYNERLRMPKFPFKPDEIEAVMTFVLGLVAEPPATQYVYQPDPRQKAIVQGRQVLEQFNCAGCHALEIEKLAFEFDPKYREFVSERTFPANEYELFRPHVTEKELLQSKQTDRRGLGHAEITAVAVTNEQGEVQEQEDDDNPELMLQFFTLWENAVINGQSWLAGDQVPIPKPWITGTRPQVGGDLARLLHPVVLAAQRQVNPNAKFGDAWGWVPPPLAGEGRKVNTDWLHDFLLDPTPIRPAVVLRMPKFNMSGSEASKLANYFAAVEGEEYPYEFDRRTRDSHLEAAAAQFPGRLDDAMKIVTNGNFCVKCHKLGDFTPPGNVKEMAPQLEQISRRLRPQFLEAWLANPKRLLPFTGMPVNFPVDKALDPKVILGEKGRLITEGKSPDHLEAVIDLLLNFDRFAKEQYSIKPLIQAPTMPPAAGGGE